jgi:hypothetical protein
VSFLSSSGIEALVIAICQILVTNIEPKRALFSSPNCPIDKLAIKIFSLLIISSKEKPALAWPTIFLKKHLQIGKKRVKYKKITNL